MTKIAQLSIGMTDELGGKPPAYFVVILFHWKHKQDRDDRQRTSISIHGIWRQTNTDRNIVQMDGNRELRQPDWDERFQYELHDHDSQCNTHTHTHTMLINARHFTQALWLQLGWTYLSLKKGWTYLGQIKNGKNTGPFWMKTRSC